MCAKRNGFLFIEIISYLDPGNSYEKWVMPTDVVLRDRGFLTSGSIALKSWII